MERFLQGLLQWEAPCLLPPEKKGAFILRFFCSSTLTFLKSIFTGVELLYSVV